MKYQFLKDKFLVYLGDIGISGMFDKKIDAFLELYANQFSGQPEVIFVSEYVTPDGSREYASLWFFNREECVEARNFIRSDDLDMAPIEGRIEYLRVQKEAYDFKNATGSSRLYIRFKSASGLAGELRASGKNCDYLRNIMAKYIRPNMRQTASVV